jgi:hypothetical protein
MMVSESTSEGEARTWLTVGDHAADVVVEAMLNTDFRVLDIVTVAGLGLKETSRSGNELERTTAPIIISADDRLNTIVVGSRLSPQARVFARDAKALELERINLLELDGRPSGLALSGDGQTLAVLSEDGRSIVILSDLREPRDSTVRLLGSDLLREAQRYLARLKYYVGVIDGLDGPSTRRAVSIFQKDQGLEVSGSVNETTMQRLREMADNL